jgi:hypothetical protein
MKRFVGESEEAATVSAVRLVRESGGIGEGSETI